MIHFFFCLTCPKKSFEAPTRPGPSPAPAWLPVLSLPSPLLGPFSCALSALSLPRFASPNVQVLHAAVAAPGGCAAPRAARGFRSISASLSSLLWEEPSCGSLRGFGAESILGEKSRPWQDPVPAALSQVADVGSLGDTPAPAAVRLRAVSALLFKLNSCLLWLQDFPSPSAKPQKTEIDLFSCRLSSKKAGMCSGHSRAFGQGWLLPLPGAGGGSRGCARPVPSCPAPGLVATVPPLGSPMPCPARALMGFWKEIASWYRVCKVIGRRPAKVHNLSADEDEVLV